MFSKCNENYSNFNRIEEKSLFSKLFSKVIF